MRVQIFITSFIIFLMHGLVFSADHYIRAGASGNNNGNDWTNAWTSIPSTLVRGDTYYIADGDYGGYEFNTPEAGSQFVYIVKATIEEHGTDTGWNDTYGDGYAEFTGTIYLRRGFLEFNGKTGDFKGRSEPYGFRINATGTAGFSVRDITSSDWVIKHVYVWGEHKDDNPGGRAIDFTPAGSNSVSNLTVHRCYFKNMALPFYFINSSNFLIEYTVCEDNHSDAEAHSELASIRSSHNLTFRYNWFEDMEGTGGINQMSGDQSNWYIYGNVYYWSGDPTCQGFSHAAIGDNASGSITNCYIFNNTFVNQPGRSGIRFLYNPTNVIVRNNLWYGGRVNSTGASEWTHNYYCGDADGINVQYSGALCPNCNCGSCPDDVFYQLELGSDPFVDSGGEIFLLTSATNDGYHLDPPYNLDRNGNVRGSDGIWDRGAFEFTGDPVQRPQVVENVRIKK